MSSDTYGSAIPAVVVVGVSVHAIAVATGVSGRTAIAVAACFVNATRMVARPTMVYGNI